MAGISAWRGRDQEEEDGADRIGEARDHLFKGNDLKCANLIESSDKNALVRNCHQA